MYILQQKLNLLKVKLKKWNKETFGNIFIAKNNLEKEMEQIQQDMIQKGHFEEGAHKKMILKCQLEEWSNKKRSSGNKKTKINWLKEGEKNSAFFHRSTI